MMLPEPRTRFIGREDDLKKILALLNDASCRLLTLTGIGGIGKTRLAIQITDLMHDNYQNGTAWVDLQAIQSTEYLIPSIGDAVGVSLSGQEQPLIQLNRFLETKNILIVLDNFEHLLDQGDILAEILNHSPTVKILVTSRESLNIQEEWLYALTGLTLPADHSELNKLEEYDAIQLFVERARHVRIDFDLSKQVESVIKICQLLEGMPLAIEMAAAWTKMLSCEAIVNEIHQGIEFLTTRLRNVPERHRNMSAVFAQTWARLIDNEKNLFKRLSIFRGGFQPAAAQTITNSSLILLAVLQDKCLIKHDSNGRYTMHELVRQYAESQLEPEEAEQTAKQHCLYYATFMKNRHFGLLQGDQLKLDAEIRAELENIRVAWQNALDYRMLEELHIISRVLYQFSQFHGRYLEVAQMLEQALTIFEAENQTQTVAQVQVYLSWLLIRLGQMERAEQILKQSCDVFDELKLTPIYGIGSHPLGPWTILCVIQGKYDEAVKTGEQLEQLSQGYEDRHNIMMAHYVLTSAYHNIGNYDKAFQCGKMSVDTAEELGNQWFMAYCLNELGSVAQAMGNDTEAEQYFRSSYQIRQRFNDPEGIAAALNHLGELALANQQYTDARKIYNESLSIYDNLNDQGGLAHAHHGLGRVNCELENAHPTLEHFATALSIASQIQYYPLILSLLMDVSHAFNKFGYDKEQCIRLLQVVFHSEVANQQQRDQVKTLLGTHSTGHAEHLPTLETLIPSLQRILLDLAEQASKAVKQPLVEPLTKRELEILQLLAIGLSNAEIGDNLFISIGTVKAHTSRIYGKLGVRNRVEAVTKAAQLDLLDSQ